jgi:hypothetical protein
VSHIRLYPSRRVSDPQDVKIDLENENIPFPGYFSAQNSKEKAISSEGSFVASTPQSIPIHEPGSSELPTPSTNIFMPSEIDLSYPSSSASLPMVKDFTSHKADVLPPLNGNKGKGRKRTLSSATASDPISEIDSTNYNVSSNNNGPKRRGRPPGSKATIKEPSAASLEKAAKAAKKARERETLERRKKTEEYARKLPYREYIAYVEANGPVFTRNSRSKLFEGKNIFFAAENSSSGFLVEEARRSVDMVCTIYMRDLMPTRLPSRMVRLRVTVQHFKLNSTWKQLIMSSAVLLCTKNS